MSESVRTAFETIHFDDEINAHNSGLELVPDDERPQRLAHAMVQLIKPLASMRQGISAYVEGPAAESEGSQPPERIVGYSAHGSKLIRDLFGDTAAWALTESDIRGLIAAIETIKAPKKPLYQLSKQKITAYLLDEETNTTAVPLEEAHMFMGRFVEERMVNQNELDDRRSVLDKCVSEYRTLPPEIPGAIPRQIRWARPRAVHELVLRNAIVPIDLNDNDPLAWQSDALCAQTDPEAFFPEKGASVSDAKRVCGSCEVKTECLEYALANNIKIGIWGGKSEKERRAIAKRNAEKEAVSRAAYFEALRNQRIAAHIAKKASEQTL